MVFRGTITIEWNGQRQPLTTMVFRWFWVSQPLVTMVFRWLATIAPTMEWLHTIVEVYSPLTPHGCDGSGTYGGWLGVLALEGVVGTLGLVGVVVVPTSKAALGPVFFKTHDIIVFCMWQRVGNRKDIYPVWKEMFFFSNNFEIEILRHFNFQSDGALNSLRSEIIVYKDKNIFICFVAYLSYRRKQISCGFSWSA